YRNGTQIATMLAPQVTYSDANLANGHYQYYVAAIDQYLNVSTNSNSVDVDIAATGPAAPTDLVITAPVAGGELDASWQPGSGPAPAQYTLYRGSTALGAAGNASARSAVASGTPRDVLPPAPPELFYPTVPAVPLAIDAAQTIVQGVAEPGAFVD